MKVELIILLLSLMTFTTSMAQDDIILSCPDDNHPHAIDLGLPSGTKWACCNVGSQKPYERGGYYAWGETEEKDSYELNTYKYFTTTGYQNIGGDIAGTEYDVAHVKWGEGWQMPSFDRVKELVRGCTCSWTTMNGVIGEKFTSKYNGAFIFIPANGFRSGTNVISLGERGCYWSGTSDADPLGCTLTFGNEEADFLWFYDRCRHLTDFPWDGSTLRYKRVMNFTRNGRLLYQWDRDAFLEERLGVETAEENTSKGNGAIYSCDGRRISQGADVRRLPKGIYIQNGRTFVIK